MARIYDKDGKIIGTTESKDIRLNQANELYEGENLDEVLIELAEKEVDLSDYATKEYVDEAIENIEIEGGETDLSGYAPIDNPNFTTAISLGRKEGTTVGSKSFAVGEDVTASGENSHAEGRFTIASGYNAHAEGLNNTASGSCSHAEGANTVASGGASHTEGNITTAKGNYSHAEGNNTYALGDYSHAEGTSTSQASSKVSNLSSTTSNDTIITAWNTNKFSLAKGGASHVEGTNNLALGYYSHAEGLCTVAGVRYTANHAEGEYTTAHGEGSHAEGGSPFYRASSYIDLLSATYNDVINTYKEGNRFSLAYGNFSHSEGKENIALGEGSHAEGGKSLASGDYAHTEGISTVASGFCSHAEGSITTASGDYSHTEGCDTIASGYTSHAEGEGTIASGTFQHVQGRYNIEDVEKKYAHIVGNGTMSTKSNAHTLDWNGNGWYQGDLYVGGTNQDDANKVLSTANIYFNENGELVVTIGEITKTFVAKE